MKWIYFSALAVCLPSPFLFSTLHTDTTSVEGKIQRLEQDSGIDTQPERTTVFFSGEFLYWKASLDGVAYATTAVITEAPGGGFVEDKFKARTAHFSYDPGFQIGMGVGLPFDHWDVSLSWLRFHTEGKDTAHGSVVEAPGNRVIFDTVGMIENLDTFPAKAHADCEIHLDVLDAVLGRAFLWSRYFWFRPYAGLRGAWLKVDWDIDFTSPVTVPSPDTQVFSSLDTDNRFNAVGFVGGFDSKWNLYRGFGLFSKGSAALIYGKSSEKTKQEFTRIPALSTEEFEQTLHAKNSTHTIKSVFDISVGIKWEGDMTKKSHFLAWAGYEFFYWPNVTQKTISQMSRSRDRADLGFEGIILGARVDF